jgi:predicted lysophospholipase L1 biosynthesis ABC-type transport system permease subunit
VVGLVVFGLLALALAVGTVAHVCSGVVRRLGTDLAVVKALGVTRRGTRATLVWQATTLSVIGLVISITLGLILRRALWRIVADLVPLVFRPPFAVLATVLALPATLLIANLIALVPGRRVAHLRPAQLLREE